MRNGTFEGEKMPTSITFPDFDNLTGRRPAADRQPLEHGDDVDADRLLRRRLVVHRQPNRVRGDGDLGVVPPSK